MQLNNKVNGKIIVLDSKRLINKKPIPYTEYECDYCHINNIFGQTKGIDVFVDYQSNADANLSVKNNLLKAGYDAIINELGQDWIVESSKNWLVFNPVRNTRVLIPCGLKDLAIKNFKTSVSKYFNLAQVIMFAINNIPDNAMFDGDNYDIIYLEELLEPEKSILESWANIELPINERIIIEYNE
jgi:hypothetical protein